MVLVLLVGGGLPWYLNSVRSQREVVAKILRAGGHVYYNWNGLPKSAPNLIWRQEPPKWLLDRVGPDALGTVVDVTLKSNTNDEVLDQALQLPELRAFMADHISALTDGHAVRLGDLTHLEEIWLLSMSHGRGLSGATLARFHQLTNLRRLDLLGSPTKDAELAPLAGLTSLRHLSLFQNGISDAGLVHLANLIGLEHLGVSTNPLITSAGLVHLERLINLTSLGLNQTQVTDLSRLTGMTKLQKLSLGGTPITDAHLAPLVQLTSLVELSLEDTAIGDRGLDWLEGLANLRILDLAETQVSAERISRFQLTHPHVAIKSPALSPATSPPNPSSKPHSAPQ